MGHGATSKRRTCHAMRIRDEAKSAELATGFGTECDTATVPTNEGPQT
jgi:hypothetical protein